MFYDGSVGSYMQNRAKTGKSRKERPWWSKQVAWSSGRAVNFRQEKLGWCQDTYMVTRSNKALYWVVEG